MGISRFAITLMFIALILFSGHVFASSFPIANQPLVGEAGFAGAGDGNGNFLVSIAPSSLIQTAP